MLPACAPVRSPVHAPITTKERHLQSKIREEEIFEQGYSYEDNPSEENDAFLRVLEDELQEDDEFVLIHLAG